MTPQDQVLSTEEIYLPQRDKGQGNKRQRQETEDEGEGGREQKKEGGAICPKVEDKGLSLDRFLARQRQGLPELCLPCSGWLEFPQQVLPWAGSWDLPTSLAFSFNVSLRSKRVNIVNLPELRITMETTLCDCERLSRLSSWMLTDSLEMWAGPF